jgi:Uma2 family endonuclease
LTTAWDDGIVVVVMDKRENVTSYLEGPEWLSPRELVWGMVRDAPAPWYGHQLAVGQVFTHLDAHVRAHQLGVVLVAPLDVVLDEERALIVQPDVLFVSESRRDILRRQVWGAPDLVVEVASRRTARRDRTLKLGWYRKYGVRECWLVDPERWRVTVIDLAGRGRESVGVFAGGDRLRSAVLPAFDEPANACFGR